MIIIQVNKLTWPARLALRYSPRLYDILSRKPWFVAISKVPDYSRVSTEDVEFMDYTLAETVLPMLIKFKQDSEDCPFWAERREVLQTLCQGFEMLAGRSEYEEETVEEALQYFADYYREFYL